MNLFILKVLRRLKLADRLRLVGHRQMLGTSFRFPISNQLGWQHTFDSEPWMTTFLKSLKSYFDDCPDHAFADIGVNVGQTLAKFRAIQPRYAYVGFEPNATCMAYIHELVAMNNWTDVDLYPVAVSAQAELCSLNFFHDSTVDSTASIVKDFRPDEPIRRTSHVAAFPLEMVRISRPLSFVKIDVEGAELEVLLGAETLIRRDRPLVSMEILPCYEKTNEFRLERQRRIESLMGDLDFRCYRIAKTESDDFGSLDAVDVIGVHDDVEMSDYLWIPMEKVESVCSLVAAVSSGDRKAN